MAKKITGKQILSKGKKRVIANADRVLVQSPYLYLQSSGSDGADGTSDGFHLRWDYLRNLGRTHLPKGNLASNKLNFNRPNDFVRIFRSVYNKRHVTIIDFSSQKPDVVNDTRRFWIYLSSSSNTNTTVYIHFLNAALYNNARSIVDPSTDSFAFIRAYGNGPIEAEVKDKLFFAVEFETEKNSETVLRTEAISVVENLPLSDAFVSCRKLFTRDNWCDGIDHIPELHKPHRLKTKVANDKNPRSCCSGETNLIYNGDFELGATGFDTEYQIEGSPEPKTLWVGSNAQNVNSSWAGVPHKGGHFLMVNGATDTDVIVWKQTIKVIPEKTYCFSGSIATMYTNDPANLEIIFKGTDGSAESFFVDAPPNTDEWHKFEFQWTSKSARVVVICIIDRNKAQTGNDFGLDDLKLCEKKACKPRIVSENMHSVRFDISHGYVKKIEFETYKDFIGGGNWELLEEEFSLSIDDSEVLKNRLDNASYQINDKWPKFNDGAKVNIANYVDRWLRDSGLKYGVKEYISLSNSNPMALANLPGTNPEDGSVDVSYLDMLKLVALDFHVARMLGQGTIDQPAKDDAYIYLAHYITEGQLDIDNPSSIKTAHIYMTIPTKRIDYRLPPEPVLKPLAYGLFIDNGLENPSPLTDADGYTPDGQIRFISTFIEQEDADPILNSFFNPPELFCSTEKTNPVFWGMEYRKIGEPNWRKPEISHDPDYHDTSSPSFAETNPIPYNGNEDKAVLVHEESEAGFHEYAAYGINWFSRASNLGNIRKTNETIITKANTLIPPANFKVQLIQEESPLLLTTDVEQINLADGTVVPGADKTYIRATFDYFHTHDLNYQFADKVKLYFREDAPNQVLGELKTVQDLGSDPRLSIVSTTFYTNNSTGEVISPVIPAILIAQFVGGILVSDGRTYIIHDAIPSTIPEDGPTFILRKIVENTAVSPGDGEQLMTSEIFIAPDMSSRFLAVENMADPNSWGPTNPLSKVINIGDPTWSIETENYTEDGEPIERELQGIWENSDISDVPETGTSNIIGIYKIQFQSYILADHSQANDPDSVNWYNGVVRISRESDPNGPKKVLEVIKIEELGTGFPLRIFAVDNTYDSSDPIQTGIGVDVNYYPGYKVYLLKDSAHNLDEAHILPSVGDGHKKTWMGAVTMDSVENYSSNVGIPAPIIAMELVDPIPPEAPGGADYATRPDYYYKSTYTFTMQFAHQPFAVAVYRATEDSILRALYSDATIAVIRIDLKNLGEDDPYRSDRWKNLVSLDYIYDDPSKPFYDGTGSNANGTFRRFPREAGNYRFPKPDKIGVFSGTDEPGTVLQEVKNAIYEIFTPLTEQPLLYQYIQGGSYQPIPKPQTIRDKFGDMLHPTDPEFDQAPMAKNLGGNKIRFTDFTLDGSSNMLYFYLGREISNRGKMSDPSPISGPIFLINTKPGDAPGIKKIYSIPKGPGTDNPSIEFEINGYAGEQKIRKVEIYRSTIPKDALTVRTMLKVKTVDLVSERMAESVNYKIRDDFEDGIIPYGDPLYYRIIALREVRNAKGQAEFAPSLPSKLLMTSMIDTENPPAPKPRFTADLPSGVPTVISNVVIEWDTTVYNGTYYLEKMNNSGNWNTIYIIKSNDSTISVDLSTTDLGSNILQKQNDDGEVLYNRFRVRVENSSGLFGLNDIYLRI